MGTVLVLFTSQRTRIDMHHFVLVPPTLTSRRIWWFLSRISSSFLSVRSSLQISSRSPSLSGSGSPPSQYLHSSSLSPDGVSEQDLLGFSITSMAQRGNIVIPEVGRLLQFPPPSPKELDRPSFSRDSTHCAPPQKIQFPVDSSCADIMDNALNVLKKKICIPARELNLFKTNEADSDTYFTVPKIATVLKSMVLRTTRNLSSLTNTPRNWIKCWRMQTATYATGLRSPSFLLLLSDTLVRISEDPTSVDPDLLQTMFKFMDDCLHVSSCLREFAVGFAITIWVWHSF